MLLAVGGVLFWILVAVVCVLLLVTVEYEKWGWATISVIATFALLGWLGDFSVWNAVANHPFLALAIAGGYVLLGVGWSFGKWYFFVLGKRDKYLEAKAEYDKVGDRINNCYRSNSLMTEMSLNKKPLAKQHKGRILTWMIYWPWSMIWTVLNDPIKKFFKYLFRKLQATYQRIADRAYAGVEDLPPPAPKGDKGLLAQLEDQVEELEGEADLKKYLGLTEEMAKNAIVADGKRPRTMKRDGDELGGDCRYDSERVNLEVDGCVVVKAWIG